MSTATTLVTDITQIYQAVINTPDIVLVPAALWFGKLIKRSSIDNAYIPVIVILFTGILGFIVLDQNVNSFIIGIRSGLFTVATHQSFKQINRKRKRKKKKE
ncbi:hypothetical protein D1872_36140 [compost metagenome]